MIVASLDWHIYARVFRFVSTLLPWSFCRHLHIKFTAFITRESIRNESDPSYTDSVQRRGCSWYRWSTHSYGVWHDMSEQSIQEVDIFRFNYMLSFCFYIGKSLAILLYIFKLLNVWATGTNFGFSFRFGGYNGKMNIRVPLCVYKAQR